MRASALCFPVSRRIFLAKRGRMERVRRGLLVVAYLGLFVAAYAFTRGGAF